MPETNAETLPMDATKFGTVLRMRRSRQRGVSLIELLTVVVIVAILGGIAVSSYRRYIVRSNRTEAKGALLRVQVAQEKFFLQNNRYVKTTAELSSGLGVPATTQSGMYAITLDAASTDTSYQAIAQATSDTACATLSIDNMGNRTPTDDTGCWK
jgi:type IV pilus assembly protein PilE